MTITAQTAKSGPYSGNGVTVVFDYTFKIVDDDDLVVTLRAADGTETVQTLTTDYTVAGGGDAAGGQITMVTAPATGEKLVITRAVDLTQEVNLENRGAFVPEVIEQSFDKLTQIAQDHQEQLDRSIKVDKFDVADLDQLVSDITTLAAIDTDISTVAGVSSEVTTVAGNNANVTTVAGISGNVTTVAGIAADVTAVAADATDIGTVATNIANVNAVGGNIANVNTVAGISGNVTTVAGDSADIATVAGISLNVSTVAGIQSSVSTVALIAADVTAVAADATDIGAVAAIATEVGTVAGIAADVVTVAADGTDIGTVAGISANVTTVAGISGNVTTVAGIAADVTTVAADGADIGTVAGISSSVTTVAGNSANVTTVAGISGNVTTVAGIAADVTTAAANVADITNFADVYIGASATDPATRSDGSALQVGDLYFNTTVSLMYVYDGAAWQAAYASTSGLLTAANNLSDLADADTALINLGNPDQLARIPSKADATIAKGAVVYATGAVGSSGKITIDNYLADGSIDELYVVGIADRALAINDEGFTLHFGELTGVSTDGSSAAGTETWTAGTVLYADPANAGKLTNVAPTSPNLAIPLAMVLVAHASNGILFVRPRLGNHLTELHDVNVGTPTSGQVLSWNGSVWAAADMSGGIAYVRKTANYTASANEGVIADTSGGSFTVTLPASPATGDTVVIADGADWSTNNLTVGRNGSTIEGDAADMTMDLGNASVQFTYDGTTWQIYAQVGVDGDTVTSLADLGVTATSTELNKLDGFAGTTDNLNATQFLSGRNKIINGNFDIWQRGASGSSGYVADRWRTELNGSTAAITQQVFTLGQTDVPNEPTYFHRVVVTSVAGAANLAVMQQRVEDVRTFAGQTVTLSFWAKADAAKNIAVEFEQGFGTGGSPSSVVTAIGVTTIALTTSWQKFTAAVSIPSISGKTIGTDNNSVLTMNFWFDAGSDYNSRTNSLGQQSGTFDIAQVQLEAGDVATPFEMRSIGQELALCQRYFQQGALVERHHGGSPVQYLASVRYGILLRGSPTRTVQDNGSVGVNTATFATYGSASQLEIGVDTTSSSAYINCNWTADAEL